MFRNNYHEEIPPFLKKIFRKKKSGDLKIELWNGFVDSGLIAINDEDCSVIPRILPLSYLPSIRKACRGITTFIMRLLSLPARELKAILPATPVTDYLINELDVLKHHPGRLTGSMRYDMALSGPLTPDNPPKLMEVNEIGFDGTGRSSYIQEAIMKLIPELKGKVTFLDTAASEVKNMRRLGKRLIRFQYDSYNWEEEVISRKAEEIGLHIRMVSPTIFKIKKMDKDYKKLERLRVLFKNGKLYLDNETTAPDAFFISYSFTLKDLKEAPDFFRNLIRAKTPQYSPFITGLIAPKTVLALLADRAFRKWIIPEYASKIERSILPAKILSGNENETKRRKDQLVLKHGDSISGGKVYVGRSMDKILRRIPRRERGEWVIQDRAFLNTVDADGFLSRPKKVITDLGVYIHYDWNGKHFTNFAVGGFITRASSRSLKVNMSGGGIMVPIMFDRYR